MVSLISQWLKIPTFKNGIRRKSSRRSGSRRGKPAPPSITWCAEELILLVEKDLQNQRIGLLTDRELEAKKSLLSYLLLCENSTRIAMYTRMSDDGHKTHLFWDEDNRKVAGIGYKGVEALGSVPAGYF